MARPGVRKAAAARAWFRLRLADGRGGPAKGGAAARERERQSAGRARMPVEAEGMVPMTGKDGMKAPQKQPGDPGGRRPGGQASCYARPLRLARVTPGVTLRNGPTLIGLIPLPRSTTRAST